MPASIKGQVCMTLLSIVTIPVGMVFMMSVIGNYSRDYEGVIKTTQEMKGTIVEYINGIEVIKAFNQGKLSYAKLTDFHGKGCDAGLRGKSENDLSLLTKAGKKRYTELELAATNIKTAAFIKNMG